jgi:formate dehydrogenase major subunit
MEKIKEEALKWTPEKVEEACGVPEDQVYKAAETMALNRPSTVVWCMGQTQHTIGNAIVRASCLLQLVLGNIGKSGGGTNIFRGHDNVQGATDVGRILIRCQAILVWQRAPGSTGVMSGASITNGSRSNSLPRR